MKTQSGKSTLVGEAHGGSEFEGNCGGTAALEIFEGIVENEGMRCTDGGVE
ncbi:hypothetical protein P4N68_00755 [Corynebacterium felinum]|uniref:Uncharacterized protein n=1 Tax=Corynebacterium felinum TaxID=131318 RepID=A0ABU2B6M6_9CORY|nr:hypothetical protein [Corynebacterium felinum]MDF5819609.1 hypothetical protein [Corynebacterium felinum]MDR7354260.1 hypothetical protein [Corynebacterium felinum]